LGDEIKDDVIRMWVIRNAYLLVWKLGRRNHFGTKCKWEDNIKMDLEEMGLESME